MLDMTKYTDEELRDINHYVCLEMKRRRKEKNINARRKFAVNDKVKFMSKYGYEIVGVIERINTTTCTIRSKEDGGWRVSTTLLSHAE